MPNVGIGTTSPARLLHVAGPIRVDATVLPGSPAIGDIAVDSADSNKLKFYNGSAWVDLGDTGAAGEVNTASNQGAAGVGVFDAKSGVDLQFRNINAASNKISVTLDAGNKEIDINVNEANLNLANLGGSLPVASLSGTLPVSNGGTGSSTALNNNRMMISSGGNIVEHSAVTANRALASDVNGLPVASSVTATELGYIGGVTSGVQSQLDSLSTTVSGKQDALGFTPVNKAGDTMTGALLAATGTDAAPGIAFSGDTDTGIRSPIADSVSVVTSGTERLRVNSQGQVGIGIGAPLFSTFTVRGTSSVSNYVNTTAGLVQGFTSSLYANPSIASSAESSSINVLASFNGSTNSPSAINYGVDVLAQNQSLVNSGEMTAYRGRVKHTMSGTIDLAQGLSAEVNASSGTMTVAKGIDVNITKDTFGTISSAYGIYVGDVKGSSAFSIFANDATAPSYFAGRVGIGTTTPSYQLDVASGDGVGILLGAEIDSTARGNNNIKVGRIGIPHYSNSEEPMALIMGDSGILKNEVYVGGGSTVLNAATQIRFFTAANKTTLQGTERLTIENNGFVGIGDTSPSYTLDVAGDFHITGTPYRAGGDIAWQVPSDARLKDVVGAYAHGLDALVKLDLIRFRYKVQNPIGADSSQEYAGVLAQEVQKVIPEAVKEDPKTGFLSLNTTPIFWALVNSVKELYQKLLGLEEQVTDQSRRLASVEANQDRVQSRLQQLQDENSRLRLELEQHRLETTDLKDRLEQLEKLLHAK